jgi:hypothetical protein
VAAIAMNVALVTMKRELECAGIYFPLMAILRTGVCLRRPGKPATTA